MTFHDLDAWMQQYVQGRRVGKDAVEGKIVWVLDSDVGPRRVCAVLSRRGCAIDGDEPDDVPKLLIQGRLADFCRYLKSADVQCLSSLAFRGDARLWSTLIAVAQTKTNLLALRAGANR